MDTLISQVEAARRRLVLEQFLRRLVWCLFATLVAAAVAIAAPRVVTIEGLPAQWDQAWLIGAALAALVGAGVWTAVWRRNALDAAMEIDDRFALRERVASSLSLSEAERETPAGRALVDDALRSVSRVEIGERFSVSLGRRAWAPIVPAVIAFCLMAFVGNREASSTVNPPEPAAENKQVNKSVEELRKKLEELRKKSETDKNLKEASGLLEKVDEGAKELAKNKGADRKQAVVKLNDLAKELQQRRQSLGAKQALEEQLGAMKNLGKGPAEKAASALKSGDWNKALQELQKMQEQLAKGEMTPEQRKQLAEQLGKMQENLQAAIQARKQAMNDLKRQIAQQREQGNMAQAAKLQQKLDQMQQNQQQMNKLGQLAQQMGQAQQAMQNGDSQAAAQAMQQMAQQLGQMQQEDAELEMLDAAMTQIEMAKNAMGCEACDGMGCQACQGGMGMGMNQGMGQMPGGMGMGKGQGRGPRPDEEHNVNTRDTRVRQDPQRGASVFSGTVDGPTVAGDARQTIKEELAAEDANEADPLSDQRLPRGHREHAQEFFSTLREEL